LLFKYARQTASSKQVNKEVIVFYRSLRTAEQVDEEVTQSLGVQVPKNSILLLLC
jgi:hypothetical protein